jgi:hypothetical protein
LCLSAEQDLPSFCSQSRAVTILPRGTKILRLPFIAVSGSQLGDAGSLVAAVAGAAIFATIHDVAVERIATLGKSTSRRRPSDSPHQHHRLSLKGVAVA